MFLTLVLIEFGYFPMKFINPAPNLHWFFTPLIYYQHISKDSV